MAEGYSKTVAFVDLGDKSVNIDQWDDPAFNWLADFPFVGAGALSGSGAMAVGTPVVVTPRGDAGSIGYTGMEYWHECVTLFMRLQ